MAMSAQQRQECIERYRRGPELLKVAFLRVPEPARQWRPAEGRWSAHEVVVHCADSESHASLRIRYLLAEKEPLIVGYDQEAWARVLDYHAHPVGLAFATVEAARAHTAALLDRLGEDAWTRLGRHTESGAYSAEDWLRIYAEHLEKHAAQIDRNLAAWHARMS